MNITFTELELWLLALCALLTWRLVGKSTVILQLRYEKREMLALIARVGSGMCRVKYDQDTGHILEIPQRE